MPSLFDNVLKQSVKNLIALIKEIPFEEQQEYVPKTVAVIVGEFVEPKKRAAFFDNLDRVMTMNDFEIASRGG
jgi:hypothetical protein